MVSWISPWTDRPQWTVGLSGGRLRRARNARLSDTCRWWAFNAIGKSAGADTYDRHRRAGGDTHEAGERRLANKLISQLHHCL